MNSADLIEYSHCDEKEAMSEEKVLTISGPEKINDDAESISNTEEVSEEDDDEIDCSGETEDESIEDTDNEDGLYGEDYLSMLESKLMDENWESTEENVEVNVKPDISYIKTEMTYGLEEEQIVNGEACALCSKIVEKDKIREHLQTHFKPSKGAVICPTCGKSFSDKFKMAGHIRSHTGEKPFPCPKCDKVFALNGTMLRHLRTQHLKENFFHCDQCDQSFSTKRGLFTHMKNNHGCEEGFQCEQCKCRFVTEQGYMEHQQALKCNAHVCDECGKRFSTKLKLERHSNAHRAKTEKVYAANCPQCGKCFTTKYSLKEHERIHDNIRPYACEVCGKTFTKKAGQIAHRKAVHKW